MILPKKIKNLQLSTNIKIGLSMDFNSEILHYTLFLPGFYILIKGADLFVEGSVVIARKLKVSDLAIGLTLVAFGTSAPELAVNLISSLKGNTDLAISNILGSNIANILLILGVSSVIKEIEVQKSTTWKEIPFSLLGSVVVFFLANDVFFQANSFDILSRNDGFILLCFFVIFLYYVFSIAKDQNKFPEEIQTKEMKTIVAILYIFLGILGLIFGGDWIVNGSVQIAKFLGLTESFIGLTVVAVGTSLPELATSAVAAYKNHSEIAMGNVVGSNIFNIFFVMATSSVIKPLPFSLESQIDIFATLFASIILFIFMFIGEKHKLERNQGIFFLFAYFLYIIYRATIGGK